MKFLITLLFICFGLLLSAQEVNVTGTTYSVKKEKIFKGDVDVTETLSVEERKQIRAAFNNKMSRIKETEDTQKQLEKAEKDQKKAEKRQKKAEKALKKRKRAQSNFDKSAKKHQGAIKKYEKLKKRGKLSPEDEAKWLEKIEKFEKFHNKAKKKLKKA